MNKKYIPGCTVTRQCCYYKNSFTLGKTFSKCIVLYLEQHTITKSSEKKKESLIAFEVRSHDTIIRNLTYSTTNYKSKQP